MPKYIVGTVETPWGNFEPGETVMCIGESSHQTSVKVGTLLGYYPETKRRWVGAVDKVGKDVYDYSQRKYVFDPNFRYREAVYEEYVFHKPAVRCKSNWRDSKSYVARLEKGRIFKGDYLTEDQINLLNKHI